MFASALPLSNPEARPRVAYQVADVLSHFIYQTSQHFDDPKPCLQGLAILVAVGILDSQRGCPDTKPGSWHRWKNPSGVWVETWSILTTTPNAVTAPVHDRMPVILDPDSYDPWLDPWMTDVVTASDLLKPFDAQRMRCFPVSSRVNHVATDDEECSRPVVFAETQNRLF